MRRSLPPDAWVRPARAPRQDHLRNPAAMTTPNRRGYPPADGLVPGALTPSQFSAIIALQRFSVVCMRPAVGKRLPPTGKGSTP
jgi:hypothetical protein